MVVLEQKFSWNCFEKNSIFFHLSPTSSHFHPLQVDNCDSNSRLVVVEDDKSKFRLERVKGVLSYRVKMAPFRLKKKLSTHFLSNYS